MEAFDHHLVGMRLIFLCHCRRKGLQNDFITKHFFPARDNLFELNMKKLGNMFSNLSEEMEKKKLESDLRLADSILRSLKTILSDRATSIRGLKKDDEKLTAAIATMRDAMQFSTCLQSINTIMEPYSRSSKQSWPVKILLGNIKSILEITIPSKLNILEKYIDSMVALSIRKDIIQRFKQVPDEFSALKYNSSICCFSNKGSDLSKEETTIMTILSRTSYLRLTEAIQRTVNTDSVQDFVPVFGRVINTTLKSFLLCILEANLLIDEVGLYKLYRLILGIEEFLAKARSFMHFPVQEKFLSDPVPWIQVQLLLDYLNGLVFNRLDSRNILMVDASQLEHKDHWKKLIYHKETSTFQLFPSSNSRKKLKGTVFVALKINESLL